MSGIKTSARNMFEGKVRKVTLGAVNAEVSLDIGGQELTAVITNESAKNLGLVEGKAAFALIKASWVIITAGESGLKVSARNNLKGTVKKITTGAVNSEVSLDLGGGRELTAIITNTSCRNLALKEGGQAGALIKASHIILAVEA